MGANDAPGGTAVGGADERVVEPIFLTRAHHGAASVIGNSVDIVGVPIPVDRLGLYRCALESDTLTDL